MNGTNYKQGAILLAWIPYWDSSGEYIEKKRPILVLSKYDYNIRNNSMVVCPITSKIRYWEFSILLEKNCLKSGELNYRSELRVDHITAIKNIKVDKCLGFLRDDLLKSAIKNLSELVSMD